jgi:hypothetical protein
MADDDNTNNAQPHEPPRPKPTLRSLDVMVGTWELKGRESGPEGEIHGRPTFEWMEGGFYLVQHVDIDYIGRRIVGTEYIGYDEENVEYVWEVGDDTFTIWGGEVGSPASFMGRFSDDRDTITGRWEWPGGGYEATMTKVK